MIAVDAAFAVVVMAVVLSGTLAEARRAAPDTPIEYQRAADDMLRQARSEDDVVRHTRSTLLADMHQTGAATTHSTSYTQAGVRLFGKTVTHATTVTKEVSVRAGLFRDTATVKRVETTTVTTNPGFIRRLFQTKDEYVKPSKVETQSFSRWSAGTDAGAKGALTAFTSSAINNALKVKKGEATKAEALQAVASDTVAGGAVQFVAATVLRAAPGAVAAAVPSALLVAETAYTCADHGVGRECATGAASATASYAAACGVAAFATAAGAPAVLTAIAVGAGATVAASAVRAAIGD